MTTPVDALIPVHGTHGDARVDHAELATQIRALHQQCYGWALTCCRNRREDAEDVLQDVYVGALDNGLRFDGRSTLRTWLFGVCRQMSRSRMRRDALRALLGVRHAARIDRPAPTPAPDDAVVLAARRDRTRRALHMLAAR